MTLAEVGEEVEYEAVTKKGTKNQEMKKKKKKRRRCLAAPVFGAISSQVIKMDRTGIR